MQSKPPISAVVVTFNEGHLLEQCLRSIQFCDEIIVVDLGSTDNSVDIALKLGARVLSHERVPIVEIVRHWAVDKIKHDWMLITDPDEAIHQNLAREIVNRLPNIPNDVAVIWAPIQFYFKQYPLKGTIWGGNNNRLLLLNKQRIRLHPKVHHAGIELRTGFRSMAFPLEDNNIIHHYWMQSYGTLISKHRRYIKQEGKAKFESGERGSFKLLLKVGVRSFYQCYIVKKGYRDGLTGLFLSLLWGWYNTGSTISLLKYQRFMKNKTARLKE